jgi:hypothetical protein
MREDRSKMTVRMVPLRSREAGESRVAGTVAERIALVAELSEMLWDRTGKPRPSYTRATMPIVLVSRSAQRGDG